MRKLILVLLGFMITACLFPAIAQAKFDYSEFEKTLDKYERAFSNYKDDIIPVWDKLFKKNDASGLKECDVVSSIIDNILVRIRKLRVYIEFRPLIAGNKMSKFENMLVGEMSFTKRRLTQELEGFGRLEGMPEVIAMLKNATLIHILSGVKKDTRSMVEELDKFITQLK